MQDQVVKSIDSLIGCIYDLNCWRVNIIYYTATVKLTQVYALDLGFDIVVVGLTVKNNPWM